MRHMAIGPRSVPIGRRPTGIKETGLYQYDKGLRVHRSTMNQLFRAGDLLQVAPQMNGSGAAALGVTPGDRAAQGPIHLEDPGSIPESLQAAPVVRGQPV